MRTIALLLGIIVLVVIVGGGAFIAANWAPELPVSNLIARWAPPPSQFIEVNGLNVHVRDEGPRDDPSPVVLLHGTGSSLHAFQGWAEALRDKKRVIRFDMAGFGLTGPSPDHRYSIDRDVALVIALMDKLGVQRFVIGGDSLGGTVAWRTALDHPDRVDKLILIDSGGYGTKPISAPLGFQIMRLPLIRTLLENTLPRFLVAQGFRNVFGDPSKVTDEMIDRSVQLTQREGNRRALIDRFAQRQPDLKASRIPELKLPTLILWGERDRLVPPSDAEQFHYDIKGSELVILKGLGHAPEEEDPAASVEPVKKFLGLLAS